MKARRGAISKGSAVGRREGAGHGMGGLFASGIEVGMTEVNNNDQVEEEEEETIVRRKPPRRHSAVR